MLATIIIDTFQKDEAKAIAAALDTLCSPMDNGFSSAAIYGFWSLPKRELLYIGLTRDVRRRFREHVGLIPCKSNGCKFEQLEDYFASHQRIGYSILVQSAMSAPTPGDGQPPVLDEDDDAALSEAKDVFDGEDNVVVAEGMIIEMFHQLADRLPAWNKVRGAERGQHARSLFAPGELFRLISGDLAEKSQEEMEKEFADEGPPYELILNMEGSELSELNAKATLREIAKDASYCANEEFLHAIRMRMVANGMSFASSIEWELASNPDALQRISFMKESGYWNRILKLPGVGTPA